MKTFFIALLASIAIGSTSMAQAGEILCPSELNKKAGDSWEAPNDWNFPEGIPSAQPDDSINNYYFSGAAYPVRGTSLDGTPTCNYCSSKECTSEDKKAGLAYNTATGVPPVGGKWQEWDSGVMYSCPQLTSTQANADPTDCPFPTN